MHCSLTSERPSRERFSTLFGFSSYTLDSNYLRLHYNLPLICSQNYTVPSPQRDLVASDSAQSSASTYIKLTALPLYPQGYLTPSPQIDLVANDSVPSSASASITQTVLLQCSQRHTAPSPREDFVANDSVQPSASANVKQTALFLLLLHSLWITSLPRLRKTSSRTTQNNLRLQLQ